MSKFNLLFKNIITELINPGIYPSNIYLKNTHNFFNNKIDKLIITQHPVDSDAKRLITYSISEDYLFSSIDSMLLKILNNNNYINFINLIKENRFCGLLKLYDNESKNYQYFKIIINFQKINILKYNVILKTLIEINILKYNKLKKLSEYIDSKHLINKIILLN